MKTRSPKVFIAVLLGVLAVFALSALLCGWAVSELWNIVAVPQGASPMTLWQGVGAYALSQLLFSGIRYASKGNNS